MHLVGDDHAVCGECKKTWATVGPVETEATRTVVHSLVIGWNKFGNTKRMFYSSCLRLLFTGHCTCRASNGYASEEDSTN